MEQKLKIMYWAIEVNLLLWIAALVCIVGDNVMGYIRTSVVIGVIGAAILQFWAHYDLTREYQRNK